MVTCYSSPRDLTPWVTLGKPLSLQPPPCGCRGLPLTGPRCQPARGPSRIHGARAAQEPPLGQHWEGPDGSVPGPTSLDRHAGLGAGAVQTLAPWIRHYYLWGLTFLCCKMRALSPPVGAVSIHGVPSVNTEDPQSVVNVVFTPSTGFS